MGGATFGATYGGGVGGVLGVFEGDAVDSFAESVFPGVGHPQLGQAVALSEYSLPHSEQLINAILYTFLSAAMRLFILHRFGKRLLYLKF